MDANQKEISRRSEKPSAPHTAEVKFSILELPLMLERIRGNLAADVSAFDQLYRAALQAAGRCELNADEVAALDYCRVVRTELVKGLPNGDDPDQEPI